jgi:hypothetical protein
LFDTLQHSFRIFGAFGQLGVVPMAQTARDDGSVSASGDVTGRGSHSSTVFAAPIDLNDLRLMESAQSCNFERLPTV